MTLPILSAVHIQKIPDCQPNIPGSRGTRSSLLQQSTTTTTTARAATRRKRVLRIGASALLVLVILFAVAESFSPLLPIPKGSRPKGIHTIGTIPRADSATKIQQPRALSSPLSLLRGQVNGEQVQEQPTLSETEPLSQTAQSNIIRSSQSLTPQQILYPEIASLFEATYKNGNESAVAGGGVPLFQAFRTIKEALEKIATASPEELKFILGEEMMASGVSVLRIEQAISHSVDPLGWLYAQNQRQIYSSSASTKDALFYIQSTVETAVFGSAWTWDHPTNGNQKEEFWNVVSTLPQDSYLYGGERFDTKCSSNNNNQRQGDWKDFGSTWWVLPAVELKEEPAEQIIATPANDASAGKRTSMAIHLVNDDSTSRTSWQETARETLQLLQRLSDVVTDAHVPATNLPPVMMRDSTYKGPGNTEIDGQDLYERGVTAALEAFADDNEDEEGSESKDSLKKVVLARRMDLQFQADLSALDILRKWKYNEIHEGGNMFYMRPAGQEEFFGCTPERLFTIQKNSNVVLSEALAGTRPRGTSQAADEELLRDLFGSLKDRNENVITAKFIRDIFAELGDRGLVEMTETLPSSSLVEDKFNDQGLVGNQTMTNKSSSSSSGYFVRRLRHLQHICQRFSAKLASTNNPRDDTLVEVIRHLLANLHPTPAVCGFPAAPAMDFIREHESIGFDRGFYAGPVGFMGRNAADILVAIRSGLVSQSGRKSSLDDYEYDQTTRNGPSTRLSVYAGAGLVPGSTVQGEWSETSIKLGVISSLFPQSPMTLQSAPTPNVAWANAFVEELIRNGVTQFYVCPGSRSTPLVAAIAKAARSNVGVVNAVSVHDERGAGFRSIGYGRGVNRPAAVITSSGTAIANLYPAIIEAGMDGVPMIILTADRPYENRDTGANQAIDQVKAYSSSYVRWFRDILPPHDDVPVSVALADAGHAVAVARSQRGPVHVNIQFRENLAPDSGPVRNDNRASSAAAFDGFRFTDAPGFSRWSTSGDRWLKSYQMSSGDFGMGLPHGAVAEVARLVMESKRGIIVVGNIRRPTDDNDMEALSTTYDVIASFAETIGFPIIAGAQNAHLRFSSPAVIPYAEHILKNPTVSQNIKPDLILQIGAPLVSAEVPSMILNAVKDDASGVHHILLHPHHGAERVDPSFTVSRRVSADISPFLKALSHHLDTRDLCKKGCSSELSPLVRVGRQLHTEMPSIINGVSESISKKGQDTEATLTEPQVVLVLSMMMSNSFLDQSIFLSNSMPIRDAEFFLYPTTPPGLQSAQRGVLNVGSNRGASGIDGIISSATGFAESTGAPTTLLIGDVATLHDLNSFHALTSGTTSSKQPLTTILVNNDGGGIFSFLPIAKHGADVSFDDFFGTPTNTFSYKQGIEAFGLTARQVSRFDSLCTAYVEAMRSDESSVIEAKVVEREVNVEVHKQITLGANAFIDRLLGGESEYVSRERLPIKMYSGQPGTTSEKRKTLVLLHGWMGDKTEWDDAGKGLARNLGDDWDVLSLDLPAHGETMKVLSSDRTCVRSALKLDSPSTGQHLSVDEMARSVLLSLSRDYGIDEINALAGYSLGGRVALAMRRLCSSPPSTDMPALVKDSTKLALVSSYPGELPEADGSVHIGTASDDLLRLSLDKSLAKEIDAACDRSELQALSRHDIAPFWSEFLLSWYGMPMWGKLMSKKSRFNSMIEKRRESLSYRGRDLAEVLRQSSPSRNSKEDWRGALPSNTLFLAGNYDSKYLNIGRSWSKQGIRFVEVPDSGHALLLEAAGLVADEISAFVLSEDIHDDKYNHSVCGDELEDGKLISRAAADQRKLAEFTLENQMDASKFMGSIDSLDFDPFVIDVVDESSQQKGVFGIGWGDQAKKSNQMTNRSGFILQLVTDNGSRVGLGEVSPLAGLHPESIGEAEGQLVALKQYLENSHVEIPNFSAPAVLALDGNLSDYITGLARDVGLAKAEFSPSVRSGLEMALISLASQVVQIPVHEALFKYAPSHSTPASLDALLPVNGLIARGSVYSDTLQNKSRKSFPSLKVKVGHEEAMEDASSVSQALQQCDAYRGPTTGALRADANRAWDDDSALQFATALEATDSRALERLEFVEEPLQRQDTNGWSLEAQVRALERWYKHTGIPYALDESLADLAQQNNYDFSIIRKEFMSSFGSESRGCAAFVIKPALIGFELSLQMARMARSELGIGVAFSSSFDSGVGLAYTSLLAALSDATAETKKYSHGVGTFTMLDGDTLSPAFASYVNDHGLLKIASLGRALYGLGLDELRDSHVFYGLPSGVSSPLEPLTETAVKDDDNYEAATATSSSGREINLVVTLPLPFSAEIAVSKFTDFPQQSRWSPWVRSVRYLDDGRETEWTLNVRGVQFRWRAVSSMLEAPLKGIKWESISGLKNMGMVEFAPTEENTCLMKVQMSIMTPRILASLFQSTSVFGDFLQNKLLKWSLEMFRDVVKGDLALERGDVELGDALFGSAEGKANAIEATLASSAPFLDNEKTN